MLYILDRNEQVVGLLQSNSDRNKNIYYDDVLTEILSSGADTFTFISIPDRDTSKKLTVGNYIAFKKGNKFKLLQIIEVNESKEDVLTKEIYCEGAGLELINTVYSGSKMDSVNIKRFLINILQDTNWNVGYVDSNLTKTLSLDVEEKEVYSIIQEYLYDFEAEIDFRVEIKGNRIVGRYIDVYSKRGRNNGRRLEINRDIKSISRKVSLVNYATKLIGEGKNGLNFRDISMSGEINKPLGQNFVVNEEAYSRINNKGKHITRKFTYDTEDAYELLRQTYKALKEYSEPKVTYEVDADILNFDDIEIGDYVSISDLSFTPPLLVTARISELETSKTNKYANKAVLSNFNEVRSGISSIFPILGEDIVSGSIGEDQMNPDYVDSIISDSVNASMVKTEILLADKANIGDLNATNAEIGNLKAEQAEIGKLVADKADIKDLNATNATIENLKVNKAEIEDLKVTNAEIENLKANKAEITDLNATNAKIENLTAEKADITDLNALNATVTNLKAEKADIKDLHAVEAQIGNLQANKADIVELDAVKGNITHLESEVAEIDHILAGNITADNIASGTITADKIQTGSITAGSGIIADGAIGNAQISKIDAGKIEAGTIDTSKVTIQGSNGHLRLKGNRMQVFQETGNQAKERVSVGDVNGDGSVYGLRVRGADGQTILLDENGVKSEGITDGAITNDKISDDANIDGAKLNINSVVSKINEDGTETIQGTKIEVDGTTLNTKLSTITNKQTEDSERITQAQSQITANTNAIKLKVDSQTYQTDKTNMTTQMNKNTSEISAMKGEIALKVEQADIENAVSEIEGVIDTKVESAKSEIKITTDAISQNVSNLSQTVSTKADGSTVTAINNKVGSLETSVNAITGKVTNLEKTTTTLGTQVSNAQDSADSAINKANNAQSTANTANNTANANKNNITNLQGEVSTVKSNIASLEVTTSGISQKVSSVESTTATLTTQVTTAQNTANSAQSTANSANANATNALNTANSANSKIDNLNISDRNLVKNSDMFITTGSNTNKCTMSDDFSQLFNNNKGKKLSISIEVNATNALSTNTSGSKRLGCELTVTYSDDTKGYFGAWQSLTNNALNLNKKRVNNTYTIPNKDIKSVSTCGLYIQGLTSGTVKIGKPKYQISDKSSDWTPAPEDIDSTINAVDGKVTTLQGTVNTTNSKVATLETNLDGITQRVSSTESTTATLTTKVNTAQNTADSAKSAAANAQNTANTAKNTADSANTKADTAISEISKTNSKVSQITTDLSGITSRVSSVETATTTITDLAKAMAGGKILYTDPMFKNDKNSIGVYNNTGNGNVTINRIAKINGCPTSSTHCLEVKTVGTASPYFGGFYFGTPTKANQILITRIIAKIPTGRSINYHSNSIGTGSSQKWLTSTNGTGKWEEYICQVKCGDSGTFSSTNYFAISGGSTPTTTSPLIWYVAYATVIDITDSDESVNDLTTRMSTAESKLTKDSLTTTIGNHYTTSTDVNGIVDKKGYATTSQVQQTVNGLEVKVQQSGGYNLLYNGNFKRSFEKWTNTRATIANNLSCPQNQTGILLSGALTTTKHCVQSVNMETLKPFTVSFWQYTSSAGSDGTTNPYRASQITITYSDNTKTYHSTSAQTVFDTWELRSITIKPTKRVTNVSVELWNRDTTKSVYYTNVMLEYGSIYTEWSPNPNEIYDGITTIDKDGVTVNASNVKSKTTMSADGFKITKTDNNEDVFKVNADGTLYMKGSVTVTSGNAKDMVDRVVGWTYSGTTEINGGNIRTGTLSASKITAGTLDASKVTVTNLNASNIKSGKLSANYIDATNLSVKGELLSGQINGIGGMKFADGAVISSCESGVSGYKGIQISAPVIKLGDKVEINRPTIFYDVTGKNNSSSKTTTWTMSSSGALTCTSASISGTTTVGGTLNVRNNMINGMNNLQMGRGSVYIPIFGTNYTYDYIKGGASRIAFADSGPIHFLYNGSKSSFIAGGTVYLPHAGNVNCDHFRLGAGIMACPSSGSFHFLTASGNTSPLYAGRLYSADVRSASEPMVISNNSAFDKINSVNVIETKNGLNLHNPISTTNDIDESPDVVKTIYNEEKDEIKTTIDYTSAISTLWKAVQELKQENDELKEIIKSLCSKE